MKMPPAPTPLVVTLANAMLALSAMARSGVKSLKTRLNR
jgi:hypothetical protein